VADDPAVKRKNERHELIAVLLLSVTAVLTAWCGFEASKWSGEMSIAFSQASALRISASNFDGTARDARNLDLTVYAQYVEAVATENAPLSEYIEARFTPAFDTAFDAWKAGGMAEPSPFAMEEYVPEGQVEAAEATEKADAKFAEALANNRRGDNYSLLTVMFALVLFLAAMSQRGLSARGTRILLGIAIGLAVVGAIVLLTFPVRI
jgi:hypothetical protein